MLKVKRTNRSTALLTVLMFILILSITSGAYLSQYRGSGKGNEIILERMQMDFLARGVTQLALLKLKELPKDYYDALKFARAAAKSPFDAANSEAVWGADPKNQPYKTFLDQLNGRLNPNDDRMLENQNSGTQSQINATFDVSKILILTTGDRFKEDGVLVNMNITMVRADGRAITREYSNIVRANRQVTKLF